MNLEENKASWLRLLEDISEYPHDDLWNSWRRALNPLIDRALELGIDSHFRAGMGMHHLIFSTADHHRLQDEPRVTIEVTEERKLRILYSTQNVYFHPPLQSDLVEPAAAFDVFLKYLQRLWGDTNGQALPPCFRPTV